MSFRDEVKRFAIKVQARTPAMMVAVATKVHRSIKEGDATIGSPGQPVVSGFLRNSWILDIQPTHADITTNVAYAPVVEYNLRSAYDESGKVNRYGVTGGLIGPALPAGIAPARTDKKSAVGGNHSVKLTIAGANVLQSQALKELGP